MQLFPPRRKNRVKRLMLGSLRRRLRIHRSPQGGFRFKHMTVCCMQYKWRIVAEIDASPAISQGLFGEENELAQAGDQIIPIVGPEFESGGPHVAQRAEISGQFL